MDQHFVYVGPARGFGGRPSVQKPATNQSGTRVVDAFSAYLSYLHQVSLFLSVSHDFISQHFFLIKGATRS